MLLNEPRTYDLIENVFKTIKRCYSSKIVHIGMDEAHMIGLGKYLDKYGYQNRFDILIKHLEKVMDIATKHGFKPIMWSDMFFRLINHGGYYLEGDTPVSLVDGVKDKIPNGVGLVYWDYYNTDKAFFDKMLSAHYRLSDDVWFAGGAWSWSGFAPSHRHTFNTMTPAMQACREKGVDNVLITMWGDDGAECSRFALLPSLYYIKRVYDGEEDLEKIKAEFKSITGEDFDAFTALDMPNYTHGDLSGVKNSCKNLLYSDLLNGYLDYTVTPDAEKGFKLAYETLEKYVKNSSYKYVFETLINLSKALEVKCTLGIKIRDAYSKKDDVILKKCVADIDFVLKKLDEFYRAFKIQWFKENKPHGFDIQDLRIGGVLYRIKSVKERLEDYIDKKVDKIPELEEQILPYPNLNNAVKGSISLNSYFKTVSVNCLYHI